MLQNQTMSMGWVGKKQFWLIITKYGIKLKLDFKTRSYLRRKKSGQTNHYKTDTCDHLHIDTKIKSMADCFNTIMAGRIK